MRSNVLIIGASSAIAYETARIYAEKGSQLMLVARNLDKLEIIKKDLLTRGAITVGVTSWDLFDFEHHDEILHKSISTLGTIDIVLIAHGSLPNQTQTELDYKLTEQEIKINFLSIVSLLTILGKYFAERKQGTIAVISSVAGDRGRMSNYIYGSAKGALSIFLEGFRNRLFHRGVNIVTIKPGFVSTPMTDHIEKNFLYVHPKVIASGIYNAITQGKSVSYLPWFWKYIMFIIKILPEFIFKRLKL